MENDKALLDNASSKIVNVMVVIDADSVVKDFPNRSQNVDSPTAINNTKYFYMVACADNTLSGAGTGSLHIKANVGDIIRWNGISETANFDSSILIYTLKRLGGQEVFVTPDFYAFNKRSMKPTQKSVFPVVLNNPQDYWFNQASIVATGTESYTLHFALYHRPNGSDPVLYGYFKYDPQITVVS